MPVKSIWSNTGLRSFDREVLLVNRSLHARGRQMSMSRRREKSKIYKNGKTIKLKHKVCMLKRIRHILQNINVFQGEVPTQPSHPDPECEQRRFLGR